MTGAASRPLFWDLSRQWQWIAGTDCIWCFLRMNANLMKGEARNMTTPCFTRADHRHRLWAPSDYVEPPAQHDDDALRAASMMFKQPAK